jgi:ribosomal protein S18 acetylase RimI-like enzyme
MSLALPGLTIRSATEGDIDDVLQLWHDAASIPTVSDTAEALIKLLELDPEALILAELGGVVVGSVIAGWDGWRGSLYRLAVHRDLRRRGIASALAREGERRLRERGAKRLAVIVVDDDLVAMAFWTAFGLTRQEHRVRFVRDL